MPKSRDPSLKVVCSPDLLEELQRASAALRRTRGVSRLAPNLQDLIIRMLLARQDRSAAKAAPEPTGADGSV